MTELCLQANRSLAERTSLGLGGPARAWVEVSEPAALQEALSLASKRNWPVVVLGAGSNTVVADTGFDGLVVALRCDGVRVRPMSDASKSVGLWSLEAFGGAPWQAVVDSALAHDLAGVEAMTGIPGTAGAAPLQNIGAYGQQLSDVLVEVEAFDRLKEQWRLLPAAACRFAYRTSRFKEEPGRWVIWKMILHLRQQTHAEARYPELQRALGQGPKPLPEIAATVRGLRASKGMLMGSPEYLPSVGSFFLNPLVDPVALQRVRAWLAPRQVPCFPASGGQSKVPAAWLVEASGWRRGTRCGAVGLSPHHALALVRYAPATTAALVDLARRIQADVEARCGLRLVCEPQRLGFDPDPL